MTANMPNSVSAQDGDQRSGILQIVIRRRWFLLGPFFSVGLLAYGVANIIPLQYRSSAFIIIEQQKVPEQYVMPNVLMTLQKRLDSMTQQILSRTRLQRFIDDLGLYASERKRMPFDDVIDMMRKRISVELVNSTGRQAPDLTGFRIHFSDRDRYVAQRVTNELTSLFIEQDLRERTSQSGQTTAFLESQLQEASKELAAEEGKLRRYKLSHLGELPDQLASNLTVLGSLEAQLRASTSDLERADQQRVYLESMRAQQESLKIVGPSASPNPASLTPAQSEPTSASAGGSGVELLMASTSLELAQKTLAGLWKQLPELTGKFTDQHPEVMRLKKEIAYWEVVVDGLSKQRVASAELDSRLKAISVEIEGERRVSSDLRRRISEVQGQISQIPVREQELAELIRHHENAKTNFQSLLQKKQGSELASNLEQRQGGERFRLLDPATLPNKPEGRAKIVLVGWILAFIAGAGVTFLREMFDQTVHRPLDLERYPWLPVLTRIPTIRPAGEEPRRRLRHKLEVIAVAAMLVISLASGAHTYLQR